MVGVPVVGQGRAEQPHHHVPDELIERSPVPEQDLDHGAKILVQLADDGLRRGPFRGGREAANVREQHRHVAPLAAQPDERGIRHQLLDDVVRHVPSEQPPDVTLLAVLDEVPPGHAAEERDRRRGRRHHGANPDAIADGSR